MPDYYFLSKTAQLQKEADLLALKLTEAQTVDECAMLIRDFSSLNNAMVIVLEGDDRMVPGLSSPFLALGHPAQVQMIFQKTILSGETISTIEGIRVSGFNVVGYSESSRDSVAGPRFVSSARQVTIDKAIQNSFMDRIQILCTMQPVGEATQVILSLIPYLLILDILIALPAAYFYSKRLTKPILRLSAAASQMREMSPGAESGINSRDEIGELSRNLNLLYRSLCANIDTLREEKEYVNKLEKAKTDFMRAASHELKTPITALNGIVEGMIDNVGIYKNKEKYLKESKYLIDRLAKLVGEILNAAAMDAVDEHAVEPVDIDVLLENALEEHKILLDEKGLRIERDIQPFQTDTDEAILNGVILNLISNAVKYTLEGGFIRISLQPDVQGCTLSIENQCEPIPEDHIDRLFEPFFTMSYSRDKKLSGTGLGLYIVKRNLERLNLPYSLKNSEIGLIFRINFSN